MSRTATSIVVPNARVALVTGASSGIGRAIALAIARRGAPTWIVGRRADALDGVAAAGPDLDLRPIAADITREADLGRIRTAVEAGGANLDTVVHCAGTMALGTFESADAVEFDAQYQVNLRARFLLTQALLPMLKVTRGDVVFVNSTAALGPRPGIGQYAATQAAVRSLADALRGEVNGHGVRVLSVFPGRTATPLQEWLHAHEGKQYIPHELIQPDDVAAMVVAALELPRTAEVTEIVMRPFLKPRA